MLFLDTDSEIGIAEAGAAEGSKKANMIAD